VLKRNFTYVVMENINGRI